MPTVIFFEEFGFLISLTDTSTTLPPFLGRTLNFPNEEVLLEFDVALQICSCSSAVKILVGITTDV